MPLKPRKRTLTAQEIARIEQQHRDKVELQVTTGVTAGQAVKILNARTKEIKHYQFGKVIAVDCGAKGEGLVHSGNLDPSVGVIVVNPITQQPETVIGKDNLVFNIDGSPTPKTAKFLEEQKMIKTRR